MKSSVLIYKKEFNTLGENLAHPEQFLKNVHEQI